MSDSLDKLLNLLEEFDLRSTANTLKKELLCKYLLIKY
jgi:hypothetical protein